MSDRLELHVPVDTEAVAVLNRLDRVNDIQASDQFLLLVEAVGDAELVSLDISRACLRGAAPAYPVILCIGGINRKCFDTYFKVLMCIKILMYKDDLMDLRKGFVDDQLLWKPAAAA